MPMSPLVHRIYVGTLASIIILSTVYLFYTGLPYYTTSLHERFYHPDHSWLKPSGIFGQGLGVVGTLMIVTGVFGYIARKRYKFLGKLGRLKYWLEFHIFLCLQGAILILFHTSFKFGGLVSVSFWSMVAVVMSGVIGRFIYIQIPRTIEGRELNLNEIREMKVDLEKVLIEKHRLGEEDYRQVLEVTQSNASAENGNLLKRIFTKKMQDWKNLRKVRAILRESNIPRRDVRQAMKMVRRELSLNNRIARLQTMRKLFKYWHVAHLPFALVMLIIVMIHVGVAIAFGYTWIF